MITSWLKIISQWNKVFCKINKSFFIYITKFNKIYNLKFYYEKKKTKLSWI